MKINLFILGMQRTASTSLFFFLSRQKCISFTTVKETNIFSDKIFSNKNNNRHSSFKINQKNLFKFIKKKNNSKYLIEGSVNNFYSLNAPKKIKKYNSKSLFIILYRDPIERMYSHFLMDRMNKVHSYNFNDAIYKELIDKKVVGSDLGYLEMSCCKKYIKNWFLYFKKSNFLFLDYNKINNVNYLNFKLSNFLKIPINGNLSIRNQSFELKNNFFTKLMFTIKRTSISLFFPNFLKKLLSRFIYRKPNQIKIDNLLKKKLKIYFLEDMNFIKDIKF